VERPSAPGCGVEGVCPTTSGSALRSIQVVLLALLCALAAAAPASAATYGFDDFTRSPSSGTSWGTPTYQSSDSWTEVHTSSGRFYSVDGSKGKIAFVPGRQRGQTFDVHNTNVEVTGTVVPSAQPTGVGSVQANLFARADSTVDSAYMIQAQFSASTNTVTCSLRERVGGTTSVIGLVQTLTTGYDWTNKPPVSLRLTVDGTSISGECSVSGSTTTIPAAVDNSITTGTNAGARAVTSSTLTNASLDVSFDDFDAHSIGHADPKVAAVGDMACRDAVSRFLNGDGVASAPNTGPRVSTQCWQRWTSDLICDTTPGDCLDDSGTKTNRGYEKILGLGDYQYECPTPALWAASWNYGSPDNSWKRVQDSGLFRPAPGNHEYDDQASGDTDTCALDPFTGDLEPAECYFQQINGPAFTTENGATVACAPNTTGDANPSPTGGTFTSPDGEVLNNGYYSYDVGTWKIIALNSQDSCNAGAEYPSCAAQLDWLDQQLDNNLQPCVAVYFHEPKWSSDGNSGDADITAWWDEMYNGGTGGGDVDESEPSHKVDLVLNGHDHNYERLAKLNDAGATASDGIRQIIVGTGGKSVYKLGAVSGVSGSARSDVFTKTSHGLQNGMRVAWHTLSGGGRELATNTTYYVVNRTSTTFELSTTKGGAPVDFSINVSSSDLMRLDAILSTSQVRNPDPTDTDDPEDGYWNSWPNGTLGVLELELEPNSYRYRFVPAVTNHSGVNYNGTFRDPNPDGSLSDSVACNS
jgi:hypothetical protein